MKKLLVLIAVLAVASTKSIDIDQSQVQPIESVAIDWPQVQPMEDTDQYWDRVPAERQYLREPHPDRRIVNGQEATPGQFPFQVYTDHQLINYKSSCGGSILNKNNILTAAHCVWRALSGTAIVGLHNHELNEPTQQRIPFAKVYYHANYNEVTLEHDIAIIRLSRDITFNDRVQPVRLPTRGDNRQFAGFTGTVSGFGALCAGCATSNVLRYTSSSIMSHAECLKTHSDITDGVICTSPKDGRVHCQGDSGGPLTVVDGGSILQVGVVSFGDCSNINPAGSARVTYYLDWIEHVMSL